MTSLTCLSSDCSEPAFLVLVVRQPSGAWRTYTCLSHFDETKAAVRELFGEDVPMLLGRATVDEVGGR